MYIKPPPSSSHGKKKNHNNKWFRKEKRPPREINKPMTLQASSTCIEVIETIWKQCRSRARPPTRKISALLSLGGVRAMGGPFRQRILKRERPQLCGRIWTTIPRAHHRSSRWGFGARGRPGVATQTNNYRGLVQNFHKGIDYVHVIVHII